MPEKGSFTRTHTAHLTPHVNTHAAYFNQRAESPSEESKGDGPRNASSRHQGCPCLPPRCVCHRRPTNTTDSENQAEVGRQHGIPQANGIGWFTNRYVCTDGDQDGSCGDLAGRWRRSRELRSREGARGSNAGERAAARGGQARARRPTPVRQHSVTAHTGLRSADSSERGSSDGHHRSPS